MTTINPLNVFKGSDSLKKYFDPDEQPPVPLVELPDKLNRFRDDGVRIYAKLLTCLPAQNVKALPAQNMLLSDPSAAGKSVVEVSSGSTVTSLAIANRVLYNNDDTVAFVSNKAALDRVRELQFFGLQVALYGGPTYTETTDPRGPVEWARQMPKKNKNMLNLGQYDNEHNWRSHEKWTGPQIWRQLPEVNIFCMGMGSTGCVTGTGLYLKSQKPSVTVVGVCNAEADIVPGPRERPMHETSPFPWKGVVDSTETITSEESYRQSLQLSREGIICGPSSGMALGGLLQFIESEKRKGTLSQFADKATGEISCVFVTCDLPQKHMETYFKKLPPSEFKSIANEELFAVDQHVYSFRWEVDPGEKYHQIPGVINHIKKLIIETGPMKLINGGPYSDVLSFVRFLDLRTLADFESGHIFGAYSSPLPGLVAQTKSPFDFDVPQILIGQSNKTKELLEDPAIAQWIFSAKTPVVVVDYNGDTSRLLVAALRARGIEAYSFRDGMPGIVSYLASQPAN